LLTLAVPLFLSQRFDRAPLQPYEVRSASGAWTLEVKPTDPYGKGPMRARILHDQELNWSGDFAWTLETAGVSGDGTCVGYANGEKLRIAVLDPQGTLRKQHEIEHTASVMHGADLPNASGPVLVHPTADLALVRVHPADQSRPAPWRAFRLSTGEAAADVLPSRPLQLGTDQGVYAGEARVIGDTQLTLMHWWFADYATADLDWPQDGGVFALHDLEGKAVWKLALLDDYTAATSEEEDDRLEAEVRHTGVIVSAGPDNHFVLHHVREKARLAYGVQKDESNGGRWLVSERSRDGRRVILEVPDRQGNTASIHLYTAGGEPLRTVVLPIEGGCRRLSISARWIVVGNYGPIWTLLRVADERVFRFDSGLDGTGNWRVGQTPDGETLLLLNFRRFELVQYDLP